MSWAPTRAAARQLVAHGHLTVNQQKVTIPSYRLQQGDVLALSKKATAMPVVAQLIKDSTVQVEWLQRKASLGKVERLPVRADIKEAIDEQLVVEYYSR